MPQQIRMWEVTQNKTLSELPSSEIRLETQLEDWLENDISVLEPGLLVIGRQVRTDFGKPIDLLCLDGNGDTVVIELKKDKTPREVTSQALEYASWVKDLSESRIIEIADHYFKPEGSFEEEFENKFGGLPEKFNVRHQSLIVAPEMDDSTERIVRYLSDLGVPINVATVQHFTDSKGKELLAQVFLIEPEVVYQKSEGRKGGRVSTRDLEAAAEANGLGELYKQVKNGVRGIFHLTPNKNAAAYYWKFDESDSRTTSTVMYINIAPSDDTRGLGFTILATRIHEYLGVGLEALQALLPSDSYEKADKAGNTTIEGDFRTEDEVDKFIAGLRASVE